MKNIIIILAIIAAVAGIIVLKKNQPEPEHKACPCEMASASTNETAEGSTPVE